MRAAVYDRGGKENSIFKGTLYVAIIFLFYLADVMEDVFIQRNRSNDDKYLHMPTISQTDTFSKYIFVRVILLKIRPRTASYFLLFSAIICIGEWGQTFFSREVEKTNFKFDKGRLFKNRHYYHKWVSIKETFSRAIFMSNKVLYFRDTSYGLVNKSKVPAMLLLTAEVFISYSYE